MSSPPLWVEGIAPSGNQCELHLLNEGKVIGAINISGKFSDVYFVSFCQRQYTLQAVCNDNIVYEAKFKYPRDPSVPTPYDIGNIGGGIKKLKGSATKPVFKRDALKRAS